MTRQWAAGTIEPCPQAGTYPQDVTDRLARMWEGVVSSGLEGRSPEGSVFARQLNGFVAAGGIMVMASAVPLTLGTAPGTAAVAFGFGLFAVLFLIAVRSVPDRRLRICGHVAGGAAILAVGLALAMQGDATGLPGFWWMALALLSIVHLLGRTAGAAWTLVAIGILTAIGIRDSVSEGLPPRSALSEVAASAVFLLAVLAFGSFVRALSVRQISELERQRRTILRQGRELDRERRRVDSAVAGSRAASRQIEAVNEDQREADAAKAELLTSVGQEIRDPINAVLGAATLLIEDGLSSEQADLARAIRDSASELLSVIEDLVVFTRLESGSVELEDVPFRMDDLLTDVTESVTWRLPEARVELVVVHGADLETEVRGDPVRLRQVLESLVEVAVGQGRHGAVTLRADWNATADAVRFEVASTSLGSAEIDEIQDALGRLATDSRRTDSRDLPIAISTDLVSLMGGTLQTHMEDGLFVAWFEAPLARDAGELVESIERTRDAMASLNVLLVESSDPSRAVLEGQLSTWGVHCDSVGGIADAPGRDYDLVILGVDREAVGTSDQARPHEPNGDEVMARDLTSAQGCVLLVVPVEPERPRGDGVLYMQKPVPLRELRELLEWLASSRSGSRLEGLFGVGDVTSGLADRHLLVVEDNPVNAKIVRKMLERMGMRATCLSSGAEVLDFLECNEVDAVLMDCQLPEMDGYEATKGIRRREAMLGGHLPVIALTGGVEEAARRRCLEAGMDDYLGKPVSPEDLAACLAHHLGLVGA